jgi:hypothetical protein
MCRTPSKPIYYQRQTFSAGLELNLPPRGNTADRRPIFHWTPALDQPLSPVRVWVKTNDAGLRGAITAKVTINRIKKRMCVTPPISSRGARALLAKTLQATGMARTAHVRSVPCHLLGVYVSSLKIIKPCIIVPIKKTGCAQVAIQANTYET